MGTNLKINGTHKVNKLEKNLFKIFQQKFLFKN